MVMLKGNNLQEQQENAQTIENTYNLSENGITNDFLADLKNGTLSNLVEQAYGPSSYDAQVKGLEDVSWKRGDGNLDEITPVVGENAS